MSGRSLTALVNRIYEASFDDALWPDVLEEISEAFEATACHLFVVDFETDHVHLAALNHRFSLERARDYHEHYRHLDERLTHSFDFPLGPVLLDWKLADQENFEATEFYNDFYSPHGLRWCVMGHLQALFPHLDRSLRIMRRMRELRTEVDALASCMDRMPVGALIVTSEGRSRHINSEAHRILSLDDGLTMPRGCLSAKLPGEGKALAQAVAASADAAAPADARGAALAISRPSGARALQVVVAPLTAHRMALWGGTGEDLVLVLVSDPERLPMLPEARLAALYDLTPAEAQLAVQLVQGLTLKEIAETSERRESTVRWTLRNLLAKTNCHRQSELVRLLTTGALASDTADNQK